MPNKQIYLKLNITMLLFFFFYISFCIFFQEKVFSNNKFINENTSLSGNPVIRIDTGLISGIEKDNTLVFKGIPYAAPPTGSLRWKPPEPAIPWKEILECTSFGPRCPQPESMLANDSTPINEDCLYLNIWTQAKCKNLPVMFWIHGGGFTNGSGSEPFYDGEKLSKMGVVVVTINYRLGPFGFFAHPRLSRESSKDISGNYGILDQIAALKWVKQNIASFGGNPECITIFGESAGASSVICLMVSPLAKGLFSRAIAQSGFAMGFVNLKSKNKYSGSMEKTGESLAKKLGCENSKNPVEILRGKSAEQILAASNPSQGLFGRGIKFRPVIDGYVIPDVPSKLFNSGKQHKVPFITGINADEGTIFISRLPIKNVIGYKRFVKLIFKNDADEVLALYPVNNENDIKQSLNKLITDSVFLTPAVFAASRMSRQKSPSYLYFFTKTRTGEKKNKYGAFHGLDIAYIFGNSIKRTVFNEKDIKLSKIMTSFWVHFAQTGNPNGSQEILWPAYDDQYARYIELGEEVTIKNELHKAAYELFSRILIDPDI